jgi:hypothetical protein
MSIGSREDANKYYQLINGLVDEYLESHKIRPSRLKKYLTPGGQRFNKFLERNKLNSIQGADRILRDVIEDREYMEKDGVITFESFNLFESSEWKISNLKQCIYKGIDKAGIDMEKVLADYFDTNLGSIDVLDSDKHKFKIEDWKNDDWMIVVYSEEELDVIKENIIDHLLDEISEKELELGGDIKIKLNDLIKEEIFSEKLNEILTKTKMCKIIAECLGEDWSFEGSNRYHFIWVS